MIDYSEFEETLFEFDMRSIYIDQMFIQEELMERRGLTSINESLPISNISINNIISKIFDSICELIDKAIMNIRKAFQNIGMKSIKDTIEKLRKSTNDPKDGDFEMKLPKAPLMDVGKLKSLTFEDFTGITIDSGFHGSLWSYKNTTYCKEAPEKYISTDAVSTALNIFCNKENKNGNVDNVFTDTIKEVDTIKINKGNCRKEMGNIEKYYDVLDKFMSSQFSSCINTLAKLKQDARKMSIKSKTSTFRSFHGSNRKEKDREFKKNVVYRCRYYQDIIKYATKYLFQSTAFHVSCLKKNVNNMSTMLL